MAAAVLAALQPFALGMCAAPFVAAIVIAFHLRVELWTATRRATR